MGASDSHFTKDELQEYSDLTYFTKKQVIHLFNRFMDLDHESVSRDKNYRIPRAKVLEMPELKVNPFADRICDVFSTSDQLDGSLSFEDFLDMMNAFSDDAPKNLKAHYAFKVYDFNDDDSIDSEDIQQIIERLTGEENVIQGDELKQLVVNIMNEADLDNDNQLSFAEFEHVISKSPDFLNSFRMRL